MRVRAGLFTHLLTRMTFVLALVALAFILLPRERSFVVEARTEHAELTGFGSGTDEGWRIDGFALCAFAADDLFAEGPGTDCVPVALPAEPFLHFGPEARVTVRRLGEGDLVIEIARAGGDKPIARLSSFSGADPGLWQSFDDTLRLTRDAQLDMPLVFRAGAILGQIPDPGAAGILLAGSAASNIDGRLSAGRYEIARVDLAAGDVVTMQCATWRRTWFRIVVGPVEELFGSCQAGVQGFLRLAPPDQEGVDVVMTGRGDHLRIDRLGAQFHLQPTWAARLTRDPLALALATICTLLGAVLALLPERARPVPDDTPRPRTKDEA